MKNKVTNQGQKFKYRDSKFGYLMVIPALLLLMTFAYVPLIMAVKRSFEDYNTGEWNNFSNYDYILNTPSFTKSFGNVILFTLIILVSMVVLSFFFAYVLKTINVKVANAVKIIIYIPCLLSGVVTAIIYLFMLNYRGGLLTSVLIGLGKDPIAFVTKGNWPILCILLPTFWLGFGYNVLVMYAGLLNVPKSYYESAKIDGANFFQQLFFITIPNMKNTFILMIVNLVTGTLQMMDIPLLITGGGPLDKTMTPALYLYNTFRDPLRPQNVTIAGALLIMVVIVMINIIAFKLVRSKELEE